MPINFPTSFSRYSRYPGALRHLREKKNIQAYALLTLSLLTISFFIVTAIRPTLRTIAGLVAELNEKKEIEKQLESKINNLSLARANYENAQQDLSFLDQALPVETEFTLLLMQIEDLAKENKVSLEGESFPKVHLLFKNETQIQFKLLANASYQDLQNFATALENYRRVTVLNSYLLKKAKSKDNSETLVLEMEAQVKALKK